MKIWPIGKHIHYNNLISSKVRILKRLLILIQTRKKNRLKTQILKTRDLRISGNLLSKIGSTMNKSKKEKGTMK
tara:strand:+ start:6075 stop:6296 length:222 start_codon:yes stop_codon:yes gene_type:complete